MMQSGRSNPIPTRLHSIFSPKILLPKRKSLPDVFGGGCINDTIIHLATSQMPFGGVGESGMGCYHGKEGFECFTHQRSIVDKKTWMDLPIRYQKYRFWKEKMLRVLPALGLAREELPSRYNIKNFPSQSDTDVLSHQKGSSS